MHGASSSRGDLTNAEVAQDPYFGVSVPMHVPGVPDEVLQPMKTWHDEAKYDTAARELAGKFKNNFKKFENVPGEVLELGGPTV